MSKKKSVIEQTDTKELGWRRQRNNAGWPHGPDGEMRSLRKKHNRRSRLCAQEERRSLNSRP